MLRPIHSFRRDRNQGFGPELLYGRVGSFTVGLLLLLRASFLFHFGARLPAREGVATPHLPHLGVHDNTVGSYSEYENKQNSAEVGSIGRLTDRNAYKVGMPTNHDCKCAINA